MPESRCLWPSRVKSDTSLSRYLSHNGQLSPSLPERHGNWENVMTRYGATIRGIHLLSQIGSEWYQPLRRWQCGFFRLMGLACKSGESFDSSNVGTQQIWPGIVWTRNNAVEANTLGVEFGFNKKLDFHWIGQFNNYNRLQPTLSLINSRG